MTRDELAKRMRGKRWFWVVPELTRMVDRLIVEGRAVELSTGARRYGRNNSIREITRRARIVE